MRKINIAVVFAVLLFGCASGSSAACPNGYTFGQTATINGTAGQVASINIDTVDLINAGQMRPDRKDLRVLHNGSEIDYKLKNTNTIYVKVQATGSDTGYNICYGNPTESTLPHENYRNVLPFYAEGTDQSLFNGVTGTSSVPIIRTIKLAQNPVMAPGSATNDAEGVRNSMGLYFENGYYYSTYSANANNSAWLSSMAKSTDRKNWTRLGVKQFPTSGYVASDPCGFWKVGSTYYSSTLQETSVYDGVVLAPYDNIFLYTASSIEGPYTMTAQKLFHDGSNPSSNNDPTSPFTENGTTYPYLFTSNQYSGCGGICRGVTYIAPSDPANYLTSSWSRSGVQVIPGSEQVESAQVTKDSNGRYWIFTQGIALNSWEYTLSSYLYYGTTNAYTYNTVTRTELISPDYGTWDSGMTNLTPGGFPLIKDGMLYYLYDGRDTKGYDSYDGNNHRSLGMVEMRWPPPFGIALTTTYGTPVTSVASVASAFTNATVKVRVKFTGTNAVKMGIGNPSGARAFVNLAASGGDTINYEYSGGQVSSGFQRNRNNEVTISFRISSTGYTVIYEGTQIGSGAANLNGSSFYINADATIENIEVIPTSFVTSSLSLMSTINPTSMKTGNYGFNNRVSNMGSTGKIGNLQ